MSRPIRVTVEDLETGEKASREIAPGDYALICVEPCRLHHTQADLRAGTHVITVKGVRRG